MSVEPRRFEITLRTNYDGVAGYLAGYLGSMHKEGSIRLKKLPKPPNTYRWSVEILRPTDIFNGMIVEEIKTNIDKTLMDGLPHYMSDYSATGMYEIRVMEEPVTA